MALHPDQRRRLEAEHGFAEWRGEAGAPGGAAIRDFEFKGDELPGWELTRVRRNEALEPPRLDSFWRPAAGGEALLGVQIVERPSAAAARETLLERLGEVQSAALKRLADPAIGEVAFGQEFSVMFVRGNVVALVRNAGPRVVTVTEAARQVDAAISRALRARPA